MDANQGSHHANRDYQRSPLYNRFSITSSTATADNLPGPGRGLDNLYQFAGRKLERIMGDIAHRMGYGPAAVQENISEALNRLMRRGDWKLEPGRCTWVKYTAHELVLAEEAASKGCVLLIKFLQSTVPSTQYRALSAMVSLRTNYPSLAWALFKKHDMEGFVSAARSRISYIGTRPDEERPKTWKSLYEVAFNPDHLDRLLSISHKAFLCVEDNELNKLMTRLLKNYGPSDFYSTEHHYPYPTASSWTSPEYVSAHRALLEYFFDPDLAFLAFGFLEQETLAHPRRLPVFARMDVFVGLCHTFQYMTIQHDVEMESRETANCLRELRLTSLFIPRDKEWVKGCLNLPAPPYDRPPSISRAQLLRLVWVTLSLYLKPEIVVCYVHDCTSPDESLRIRANNIRKSEFCIMNEEDIDQIYKLEDELDNHIWTHIQYLDKSKADESTFRQNHRCMECVSHETCTHVDKAFDEHIRSFQCPMCPYGVW